MNDTQWQVVSNHLTRLAAALRTGDHELAIGTAKDLVETVAKIVIETRGQTFGSRDDFPHLVNTAHVALGRQPGQGLASDPPIRDIAQAMKSAVLAVGDIRNTHGTGHGRAAPVLVLPEHAEMATDAALVWTCWVFRRLDHVVDGRTSAIIQDLRGGETFSRGDLWRRLQSIHIESLEPWDAERLGIAVGQRASRGTFNVLEDGMRSTVVLSAPISYRTGVFKGAFLDPEGFVRTTEASTRAALALLDTMGGDDQLATATEVLNAAASAEISYAFPLHERPVVAARLRGRADHAEPNLSIVLAQLADRIESSGNAEVTAGR